MPAFPSVVLLALMLLDETAASRPGAVTCQTGVQHIELPAARLGELPTVCISPGQDTTLSFDADFIRESLTLEAAEQFTKVHVSESTVKLVPSEKLVPGERVKLTLRFRDDDAPAGAALYLAVHAAQAATHVEVHREKRTVESCQRELMEKEAALQQCREDNKQLRTERGGPGGIIGLRASEFIDRNGVPVRVVTASVSEIVTNALRMSNVITYRSAKRVAVEVFLVLPEDAPPWTAESATLVSQGQRGVELKVVALWPPEPIAPGSLGGTVYVEAEAPAGSATGTFTLKLWDAGGARSVTLRGIQFP